MRLDAGIDHARAVARATARLENDPVHRAWLRVPVPTASSTCLTLTHH